MNPVLIFLGMSCALAPVVGLMVWVDRRWPARGRGDGVWYAGTGGTDYGFDNDGCGDGGDGGGGDGGGGDGGGGGGGCGGGGCGGGGDGGGN